MRSSPIHEKLSENPWGLLVGEGGTLGDGYVAEVESMLSVWYPRRIVRVLNTGISGNRITDLARRWHSDVLDLEPDWLAVMIGINDVWRQFDSITQPEQIDLERYESVYSEILEKTRAQLDGLALMTPFFLETNRSDAMRARVDEYGAVVERMAARYDAVFVNVQAEFDRHLEHRPNQSLCWDRVHPNRTGHLIIARAFLTALEFDWQQTS